MFATEPAQVDLTAAQSARAADLRVFRARSTPNNRGPACADDLIFSRLVPALAVTLQSCIGALPSGCEDARYFRRTQESPWDWHTPRALQNDWRRLVAIQ